MMRSLEVAPITLRHAREYVGRVHRHHLPPQGGLFAIAAAEGDEVVGVVIVGRPVARHLDDGFTAEITRLASDGSKNACSMLYAAAWRAARAMGYRKLVTYTLRTEPGTSLRAAGLKVVGEVSQRSWDTPSRPRIDKDERQARLRWEISA
jgi:hypothetical protein